LNHPALRAPRSSDADLFLPLFYLASPTRWHLHTDDRNSQGQFPFFSSRPRKPKISRSPFTPIASFLKPRSLSSRASYVAPRLLSDDEDYKVTPFPKASYIPPAFFPSSRDAPAGHAVYPGKAVLHHHVTSASAIRLSLHRSSVESLPAACHGLPSNFSFLCFFYFGLTHWQGFKC